MAWIEERQRKKGIVYKTYWRDVSGITRTKTFSVKKDAERFARHVEVAKDLGTYVDPGLGRVTLATFYDHFIHTAQNLRPSTRAKYEVHARAYILPAFGGRRLNSVTPADVRSFVAELGDQGKGPTTIEACIRLLHRLFQVAVEEERTSRNPCSGVKVPQANRRDPRFLTEEEVRRVGDLVPDRYRCLVYFLAYSGLRIGEASALRVRHLDLQRGVVNVTESSPEVEGRKIPGDTKNRKARAVYIGPELRGMLREHLTRYGRPLDRESFVFTGDREAQIRQNAFRARVFQPAARKAGIDPVPTVHDLRHTAASLMAKAGYTLLEAQRALGHSTQAMVERYSHLYEEGQRAKAESLDALLRDGGAKTPR